MTLIPAGTGRSSCIWTCCVLSLLGQLCWALFHFVTLFSGWRGWRPEIAGSIRVVWTMKWTIFSANTFSSRQFYRHRSQAPSGLEFRAFSGYCKVDDSSTQHGSPAEEYFNFTTGQVVYLAKYPLSYLLKSLKNAVNLGGCCKKLFWALSVYRKFERLSFADD